MKDWLPVLSRRHYCPQFEFISEEGKGQLEQRRPSAEHMLHHGALRSLLTPFGPHTHAAEEKARGLWRPLMGGHLEEQQVQASCGRSVGRMDGWMDRTWGEETPQTQGFCWCREQIWASAALQLRAELWAAEAAAERSHLQHVGGIRSLTWRLWKRASTWTSSQQGTHSLVLWANQRADLSLDFFKHFHCLNFIYLLF